MITMPFPGPPLAEVVIEHPFLTSICNVLTSLNLHAYIRAVIPYMLTQSNFTFFLTSASQYSEGALFSTREMRGVRPLGDSILGSADVVCVLCVVCLCVVCLCVVCCVLCVSVLCVVCCVLCVLYQYEDHIKKYYTHNR